MGIMEKQVETSVVYWVPGVGAFLGSSGTTITRLRSR